MIKWQLNGLGASRKSCPDALKSPLLKLPSACRLRMPIRTSQHVSACLSMLHDSLTLDALLGDELRSVHKKPEVGAYGVPLRKLEPPVRVPPFFTFIPHPVLTPLSHHIIYYLYKCQTRGAHSQAVLFSPVTVRRALSVRSSSLRFLGNSETITDCKIPPANSPALVHSQTPLVLRDFARLLDGMLRVAVDVKTSKMSFTLNETCVGSWQLLYSPQKMFI